MEPDKPQETLDETEALSTPEAFETDDAVREECETDESSEVIQQPDVSEQPEQLSRIVEGILFAAEKPMSVEHISNLFDERSRPEKSLLKDVLQSIKALYAERGIELKELATGFQFRVKADLSPWVQKIWEERAPRFSRAMMETLAIIAYRQPVTRGEIEEIRGVAVSSNIVRGLLDREWVRVIGHRDVPGRPALLASTKQFLDYFGLKDLEELPPLSEVANLDKAAEQLELQGVESTQEAVDAADDELTAQVNEEAIAEDGLQRIDDNASDELSGEEWGEEVDGEEVDGEADVEKHEDEPESDVLELNDNRDEDQHKVELTESESHNES